MTLTRRVRAAWPIVGAAIVFAGGAASVAMSAQSAAPPATPAAADLEGRVVLEDGAPLAGARVEALVSRYAGGRHTLEAAASARTDQHGDFRLTNLAAGRYVIAASAAPSAGGVGLAYAPTYYPGVSVPGNARIVTIADGASPPRVDIRMTFVPLAHVSGRLSTMDGRPLSSATIAMTPVADNGAPAFAPSDVSINPDGTFHFGRVPPGRYQMRARGQIAPNDPALFATFSVIVEGRDVDAVVLTLHPGGAIDGQVTIDPAHRGPPPALSSLRVRAPLADGTPFGDVSRGTLDSKGRFALRGVMAGEHQVVVDDLPPSWIVQSVLVRGREVVDEGVEVGEGQQLRGARLVITDRASRVAGRVTDRAAAAANAPVLVYAVAPQFWRPGQRRVRLLRTDADGRFTAIGLPEGDYLAVACTALDDGDLARPAVLESLRSVATPFVVTGRDAQLTVDLPLLAALPGEPMPAR
ncbi:MAG: carboxypeptidase regulatory-like domain-containing protein [Acidobacteria bacterium]|nr:carboxypeptidase regulatory-like domain-containing protein [Acidobacteriota bacterium]